MNKRMVEQVATLQTELSGWVRLTGSTAAGRWANSALTVLARDRKSL